MKTWIKRSLIGLFGAGIVVGGISACSHRQEHHGMGMGAQAESRYQARFIERVNGELQLNASQKQQLVALTVCRLRNPACWRTPSARSWRGGQTRSGLRAASAGQRQSDHRFHRAGHPR